MNCVFISVYYIGNVEDVKMIVNILLMIFCRPSDYLYRIRVQMSYKIKISCTVVRLTAPPFRYTVLI